MGGYHSLLISDDTWQILRQRKEESGISYSGQIAELVKKRSASAVKRGELHE